MSDSTKKNADSIHQPVNEKLLLEQLSTMTPSELTHALEQALDSMTEETYNAKLIDAYLDALNQKEPMPEIPSVEDAYSRFQQHLRAFSSDSVELTPLPSARNCPVRFRQIWRTVLAAAVLAVGIFGGMVAAQAAGIDVFGTMAQWTKDIFSFGTIRTSSTENVETEPYDEAAEYLDDMGEGVIHQRFSSLEAALNAYHVTEVTTPAWIPEGYTLDLVDVIYLEDPGFLSIDTSYTNGECSLGIAIINYIDEPAMQVEKNDKQPGMFEVAGTTFYLVENATNYTVAWYTDCYECYIDGPLDQKENLKKMVYSMFE